MGGLSGRAVGGNRDHKPMFGVGKRHRRLKAIVAKRAVRRVRAKAVGEGLKAVPPGVDQKAKSPVDLVLEGFIIQSRRAAAK